jgi:hypothetical protein
VTRRGEVRLLRTVKKNRGKVLREITNDFNEGGVVRVHPKTIQRYLHNNKIFRRVVRKKMVDAGPMVRGIVILETIRFVGKMTG